MIEHTEVFEAVRRGFNNLSGATDSQITDYFDDVGTESWSGHFNNIKGVLFEQEYIDKLSDEGIEASLFENPDIAIVTTTEVSACIDSEIIIDSEISNEILEEAICDTINPVSPVGFGLFGLSLLFGLPF